jgi:hypothetical protein
MNYDLTIYAPEDSPNAVFYASGGQKQSARGREKDLLLALVSPTSQHPFDPSALRSVLENQGRLFYKTSGSVTKAIRVFVDGLNKYFQQQNSHYDQPETWTTASLSLGVIHYDTLFIAQVGQSSAHILRSDGDELFFDSELNRPGLGAVTVVNPRYFQTSLKGDESFLLLPDPQAFTPTESPLEEQLQQGSPAAFIQVKPGSGKLTILGLDQYQPKPSEPLQDDASESEKDEPEVTVELQAEKTAEAETTAYTPSLAEDLFTQAVLLPDETPVAAEDEQIIPIDPPEITADISDEPRLLDEPMTTREEAFETAPERGGGPIEPPDLSKLKEKTLHGIAAGAGWLRRAEEKVESVAASKKASTTQPTYPVGELSLLAKALIAILVPLVLIAITSMVYFSRGEEHEYNYYLAQAQASINNAALMQTVELQREGWEQASNWLNQAAAYQNSAEVKSLRVQIQTALDALDGVRRLQFAPGFAASLYPGWDITAIVSLNNDLYLLDQASGAVMYMRLRNTGYELDDQFKCGAGKYGGVEVGKLVDMISVPLNNPAKAPILAIDASGKLLYCSPGGTASAVALPVPDGGWAELKRMVFDSNKLYILDTGNNALWSYRGLTANFSNPPTAFFDDPKIELATAVDLAVEGEELFLLHADGHSSHCLSSSITGMISCDEPYPYHNTEGGNPDFESTDLHFERLAYSPPPDPSVYYLEAKQAALYQFSLRLNLNKVLRFSTTDGSMPGQKVTAFYVSPDRRVFLAFGNQLYHAVLP